jgi:hypothetical protein
VAALAVVVAYLSLRHSAKMQLNQHQREDERNRRRREDEPRIEFGIDCLVHGHDDDGHLVEFTITACNRGFVRWNFRSILLRVRGIEEECSISYWRENDSRVEFPIRIIDGVQVIPSGLNFVFVEPGVKQSITYITKISLRVKFILVHVKFYYDRHTPHTSERVFHLCT